MQGRPLVETTLRIQIKRLHVFVAQHSVQFANRLHSLFLPLSNSCVQRRPVILVCEIRLGTVEHESLCYEVTLLRVL
jgi:hypothetical protein